MRASFRYTRGRYLPTPVARVELKDKFVVVGVGAGRKAGFDADEARVVADVVSLSLRAVARNVKRGARPVVVITARAGAPLWGGRRGGETFQFGRVVKVAVVEGALRGEGALEAKMLTSFAAAR